MTGDAMYIVGTKTFFNGKKITITTEPYKLYGGFFQDGVDKNGNIITVATPAQVEKNIKEENRRWKEQQKAFSAIAKALK